MSTTTTRNRKAEQAAETRALLVAAARGLFGDRGFAGTSIDEIAARVGVTIGALYHHFPDKRALFRAVYEDVERDLSARVIAGIRARSRAGATAWDDVHAGNDAFLDAALDPGVQRILLLEAPTMLGDDLRHDFARYGLGLIREGLQRSMDAGLIERQPVEPLAHLIRALLSESALLIARASDHAAARAETGAALRRLIDGLRVP